MHYIPTERSADHGRGCCECTKFLPKSQLIVVQRGHAVVRRRSAAAPAAAQRLAVRVSALLPRLLAALGRIEAEQACDDDAELKEDDGGGGGDDDGEGGAQQLSLLIAVDDN